MDRVCIAIAGLEMRQTFDYSQTQMGFVFSIFSLSHFLGQTSFGDTGGPVWIASHRHLRNRRMVCIHGAYRYRLEFRFSFGDSIYFWRAGGRILTVDRVCFRPVGSGQRKSATALGAFLSGGRLAGAITLLIAGSSYVGAFLS
jgi:hypothetical protein